MSVAGLYKLVALWALLSLAAAAETPAPLADDQAQLTTMAALALPDQLNSISAETIASNIITATETTAPTTTTTSTAAATKPLSSDPQQTHTCQTRQISNHPKRLVCVCDANQCHDLEFQWPSRPGDAVLVQTSRSGLRFASSPVTGRGSQVRPAGHTINVKLSGQRQTILGWGGAFTDATGYNLAKLSEPVSRRLLASLYGPNGLQYNMGRVPIAGTDFSTRAYSYDDAADTDAEPDYQLTKWALTDEDSTYKIPYLLKASQLVREAGGELKLFASPWSAPKWMKSNKSFVRGHLVNSTQMYDAYAEYLMKFYDAYEQHGLKFWGATVQNEPVAPYLPVYFFNSMQFSSSEMATFIADHLGPALVKRGKTRDNFKLIVGDDSLRFVAYHVPSIFDNPKVGQYVSGVAFHWYLSGWLIPYSAVSKLYEQAKPHVDFMMMSEACAGSLPRPQGPTLGGWDAAQYYAVDIIEDLKRYTGAWIDWNMALDESGGPNWSKNFVDSPIIVNATQDEFYLQPMYYVLAHFSRLFRPDDTVVLESSLECRRWLSNDQLSVVAALNKRTNHLIVTILNKSSRRQTVDINVSPQSATDNSLAGPRLAAITLEAKSVSSVVLML